MSATTESDMHLIIKLASLLGTGVPIPSRDPVGWQPDFFVLCVPIFTMSPTGNLSFQYDLEASGVYSVADMANANINSIDDFVSAVHDGTLQESKSRPFETGAKAMEFGLRGNSYIVMALGKLNWQFNRCYYAITIDGRYIDHYGNLNQLDMDGVSHSMPFVTDPTKIRKIGPRSTIAYFSASKLPDKTPAEEHPFNLHVQIIQGNQLVPITIDPDIKNDGNQPTWPP